MCHPVCEPRGKGRAEQGHFPGCLAQNSGAILTGRRGGRQNKEGKGFLEMSSLGEEAKGAVSRIHTILDEDLGASETAVDGSHVQRTFAFFALWKHGVFCFFFSFLFSVQSIENALFPLSKDTSLRMV